MFVCVLCVVRTPQVYMQFGEIKFATFTNITATKILRFTILKLNM